MLSAIGSPATPGAAPTTGESTAAIEAQLARYKKQLSDCVNCASAETTQGKTAIQELSSKIGAAEARLDQITVRKADNQSTPSGTTTANNTPTNTNAANFVTENSHGVRRRRGV